MISDVQVFIGIMVLVGAILWVWYKVSTLEDEFERYKRRQAKLWEDLEREFDLVIEKEEYMYLGQWWKLRKMTEKEKEANNLRLKAERIERGIEKIEELREDYE